jgi:hypothetical protein
MAEGDDARAQDDERVVRINLKRDGSGMPVALIVDNIEYRVVPGSRAGSLEVFSPGKSILYSQVDNYTLEVW